MFLNVMCMISWSKYFRLVYIVYTNSFENLGGSQLASSDGHDSTAHLALDKMSYSGLGHHWNRHGSHNLLNHFRV